MTAILLVSAIAITPCQSEELIVDATRLVQEGSKPAREQPPTPAAAGTKPVQPAKPVIPEGPPEFEIATSDGSTFRVLMLDSSIDITTTYGKLTVPMREIRRFEIGMRISDDEQKAIKLAFEKLTGADRKIRIAGQEEILKIGEKALPSIRRFKRDVVDLEVLANIADIETKLATAAKAKSKDLEINDRDRIDLEGSKFVGLIAAQEFKVLTGPFGEQKLKILDLVSAKSVMTSTGEDDGEWLEFNGQNLLQLQGQTGKVYRVRVMGQRSGTIYGTNTYTLDSFLPAAAVHAGILKINETAVIRIKIVQSPNQFNGTYQNNVQSNQYGVYQPGAFEVLGKGKDKDDSGAGAGVQPALGNIILRNRILIDQKK